MNVATRTRVVEQAGEADQPHREVIFLAGDGDHLGVPRRRRDTQRRRDDGVDLLEQTVDVAGHRDTSRAGIDIRSHAHFASDAEPLAGDCGITIVSP